MFDCPPEETPIGHERKTEQHPTEPSIPLTPGPDLSKGKYE